MRVKLLLTQPKLCLIALSVLLFGLKASSQYCVPRTATATCNYIITEVKVGNYSFAPVFDCKANGGYYYFNTDTLYALPSALTNVSAKNSGTAANPRMQMFIDFNNNKLFDADENFQLAKDGTAASHSGQISMSATPGVYRLRVMYLTDFSSDGCGPTTGTMYNTVDCLLKISSTLPTPVAPPVPSYCAADGPCNAGANNYSITKVTITGDKGTMIDNSSACDNYGNYTSKLVRLGDTSAYAITIKAQLNIFYSIAGVFVDWNEDFTFSETETTIINNNQNDGYDGILTIPTQRPKTGYKRMRVRNTLLVNTPAPCGTQTNGEVEDYTILYINPADTIPSCVATSKPANMETNICQALTLKWNKVKDAKSYSVYVRDTLNNVVLVNNVSTTDTNYTIPSLLTSNRAYKWLVKPLGTAFALNCDTLLFTTAANADPIANIIPSVDTSVVCIGTTIPLDGNPSLGTGAYLHTWTGSGNTYLNQTTIQQPSFTASAMGNFKLFYQVTDGNTCNSLDSIVVRVESLPIAGQVSSTTPLVCKGTLAKLNLAGNVGTIQWQDSLVGGLWQNTTLTPSGATNFESAALTETTYFRAVISNGTCSNTTNSVEIKVNDLPAEPVFASNSASICAGDVFVLHPTNYTTSIVWNDALVTQNDTILLMKAGSFKASYTDANGCKSTSLDFELKVNPLPSAPSISASPSASVCQGELITLTASGSGNITWDDAAQTQGASLQISSGTLYKATITDLNNCKSATSIQVEFKAAPSAPSITVSGNNPACDGDVITLTSSSASGNVWNDATASTSQSIQVTTTGTYEVTLTGACAVSSQQVNVVFNALPEKPLVSVAKTEACDGELLVLQVTNNPNPNATIVWNDEANTTGLELTVNKDGVYIATALGSNSCKNESKPTQLVFNPIPEKPLISLVDGILNVIALPNATYQWFSASGIVVGATSNSFKPLVNGEYFCVVSSDKGCNSPASEKYAYTISGVETRKISGFTVYPNPAKSYLQLTWEGNELTQDVKLFDGLGRMVFYKKEIHQKEPLHLDLSPGLYTLQLNNELNKVKKISIIY